MVEAVGGSRATLKWTIASAAVFFVALACALYYFKAATAPMRVAVMTWGGAGPGFIGVDKKLFGDLRVEFHVLDDTKQRQAAFQSRDFEVYLTNPDQHPKEVQMGMPGKMFLLSDFSNGADGLMARPDIDSIAALKGKRIAYIQGSASDFMLSKALASAGLGRRDVTLVELDDPNTAGVALVSGKVDAAVSWEPLMSQAVANKQARILFTSRDVPNSIIGVFIGKDSLMSDSVRLRKFVDGWLASVAYYNKNRDESLAIMAAAFKVSKEDMKGMMEGLRLAELKDNQDFFVAPFGQPTRMDLFTTEAGVYWKSISALPQNFRFPDRWVRGDAGSLYTSAPK
jgi:NitT/TauT family transport system substrate-binding protein